MEEFGFDKLPEVVRQLFEKLENIEAMLLHIQYTRQSDDQQPLSIKEAADYLHITVAALYSMTSRRLIPFNKPGKRLYFTKNDLDEWIKSSKINTHKKIFNDYHQKHSHKNRQNIL